MQFAPESNDTITFYDQKFMTTFTMNKNDDIDYGQSDSGDDPSINVRVYMPKDDTGSMLSKMCSFAYNQPISVSLDNHVVKINDETGILVEHSYQQ